MLSRNAWKDACQFLSGDGPEGLERILERAEGVARPVALIDLDQTIYRNAPRTRAVLQAIVPALRPHLSDDVVKLIEGLEEHRMGYSIRDTFRMNGLPPETHPLPEVMTKLREAWWPKFFSNEFLFHDVPYDGAQRFCERLATAGIELVYLSARLKTQMEQGTIANLERDGFPWGKGITLNLKEDDGPSDAAFKAAAALKASAHGPVVASLENEPVNLVLLRETLPAALHVFVDTVCSETPAVPVSGISKLTRYK